MKVSADAAGKSPMDPDPEGNPVLGDTSSGEARGTGPSPEETPLADRNLLLLALHGVRYLFLLFRTFYLAVSSLVWESSRRRSLLNRVVLQQVYFTAVQTLPLALMIAIGFGALAMMQASVQLPRFGIRKVEAIAGLLIFRELAPMVVALVVIARSASAMIVEIGNMRINGEIRALEILGISIDRLVVLPRIAAMFISVPLLTTVFIAGALWGGYWAGRASGLLASGFTLSRLSASLDASILQNILVRALFFGILIGTVACHHGLSVRVSATEVPQQAAWGVINALTLCFLSNLALSIAVL